MKFTVSIASTVCFDARKLGGIMSSEEITRQRATTLLNLSGDTTIVWDEAEDEKMKAIIEKKMAEGFTFFIVPPRIFNIIPRPAREAGNVDEAMRYRALRVKDPDFLDVIAAGVADIAERPNAGGETETIRAAANANEAVQHQTVAVQARRGG